MKNIKVPSHYYLAPLPEYHIFFLLHLSRKIIYQIHIILKSIQKTLYYIFLNFAFSLINCQQFHKPVNKDKLHFLIIKFYFEMITNV